MTVRPGQIIGEYRLVSFLGAGGMGDVYRAEHVRLGRVAVVKMLKHLDAGGSAWQRFFNEARIQAELNHPNIAVLYAYYDSGVTPCIIMEHVDGLTLDQMLQQHGRLAPQTAVGYAATIAETVHYIHSRGVIHRDLKPNNIKINSRNEVKLLDFGISKAAFSQDLTAAGNCIGTDRYLAPEQLQGHPAGVASDIWALGALFYEMLTGRKAFEGGTWGELYTAISSAAYTPPTTFVPELSPDLERIIATCLKKQPAQRYPTAAALANDLRIAAFPRGSVPSGATRRHWALPGWSGRGKWPYWAAGVLLAFGVGGGAVFVLQDDTAEVQPGKSASVPLHLATPPSETIPQTGLRMVRINVYGNPAQVYLGTSKEPQGNPHPTPYQTAYPRGTHLYFVLQRPGYRNCVGEFSVQDSTEANNYTYQLCKTTEPCPPSGCK